jgi:hypothetical protein
MQTLCRRVVLVSGLLLALLAATAQGQTARTAGTNRGDGILRLEIYNGTTRTVHYYSDSLSPGERETLNDLERAENEAAFVNSLLLLRQQYVTSELALEPRRRAVQEQQYGLASQIPAVGNASFPYGGIPFSAPFGYNNFGYFGGFANAYLTNFATNNEISRSLAFGVGDQGRLNDEMARTIAAQATPEAAATAQRRLATAMARVNDSERLRPALGIPDQGVVPAGATKVVPVHTTVTLKNGDKIEGTLLREDPDWVVVETATDEVSVRPSEVVKIVRAKDKAKAGDK